MTASARALSPGDLFEDLDLHPAVCLVSSQEVLCAVSLVDGSCREHRPGDMAACLKLDIPAAIAWRFSGPGPKKNLVSKPWWKRNKGVDPVGSKYETFPASAPVNGHEEFRPGDFYVGSFYDPCICLWIIEDRKTIAGVSLVRGYPPKTVDLPYESTHRLTPAEAWIWRTMGPQEYPGSLPLARMTSQFSRAVDEGDPLRRWWD